MENPREHQLLSRIAYLESLLKANNIPFEEPEKVKELQNNVVGPALASKKLETNLKHPEVLGRKEMERYSRQMILSEFGYEGQLKLAKAKVLVIGAGGIGAPALLYLAGAGIRTIGIIDGDVVEETNLHRQIIHDSIRLKMNKAESALQSLKKFNNMLDYKIYKTNLTKNNADEIVKDYDIIMDASDNAATRYLVNDAALLNNKILISGSALGWEGQLTVYGYQGGPCYRCLFPVCPKASSMMNCSTAGVVGMVPGLIGLLEAIEAVKIILGVKGVCSGEMLIYDGLRCAFKKIKLRKKQENCVLCGKDKSIEDVKSYDYDAFTGGSCSSQPVVIPPENNITWEKFVESINSEKPDNTVLLDVRPEGLYNISHLKGFKNIPLEQVQQMKEDELKDTFGETDKKSEEFYRKGQQISCSLKTTKVNALLSTEYLNLPSIVILKDVINIEGGITKYGEIFDPEIPLI